MSIKRSISGIDNLFSIETQVIFILYLPKKTKHIILKIASSGRLLFLVGQVRKKAAKFKLNGLLLAFLACSSTINSKDLFDTKFAKY